MKAMIEDVRRLTAPGRYIVAVSGGVDSVVLLDILAQIDGLELVVAHFDHGIRSESSEDEQFVKALATDRGLGFVSAAGQLGRDASENIARRARYEFLRQAAEQHQARAIITAHHRDDVLETIILNLQRGTGSKGLSSLQSSEALLRPLLEYGKHDLLEYAQLRNLSWREDDTKGDTRYARNRVRHQVLPKLSDADKVQFLRTSQKASKLNAEISHLVEAYLATQPSETVLERGQYKALPQEVGYEVLVQWLRRETDVEVSWAMIARLDTAVRQGRNSSQVDVARGWSLYLQRDEVVLQHAGDK